MINVNFEGFRYHKPLPNFYSIDNPKNPKTIISDDLLVSLTDLALKYNYSSLSYSKLSEEFNLSDSKLKTKRVYRTRSTFVGKFE